MLINLSKRLTTEHHLRVSLRLPETGRKKVRYRWCYCCAYTQNTPKRGPVAEDSRNLFPRKRHSRVSSNKFPFRKSVRMPARPTPASFRSKLDVSDACITLTRQDIFTLKSHHFPKVGTVVMGEFCGRKRPKGVSWRGLSSKAHTPGARRLLKMLYSNLCFLSLKLQDTPCFRLICVRKVSILVFDCTKAALRGMPDTC